MYTNAISEIVVKTRSANASEPGEKSEEFQNALNTYMEQERVQPAARMKESGFEGEQRNKQRKLMEMRSRITDLKAQIGEPGSNEKLESELSLVQMQMFYIMTDL